MKNDGFITVDVNGKIHSLVDGRIEREYQYIVNNLVEGIIKISGDNVRSILLRGSVAYKNVLPGISDIDMVIILKQMIDDQRIQIENFAALKAAEFAEVFSTVDLSCYEYETCLLPENNRLFMNIKFSGLVLYGENVIKLMPDVYCDISLAEKIFRQTVMESKETLQLIREKTIVEYMGIKRQPAFLCVWYMRSFCRGLIALTMLKEKRFSLNVKNCCEEFVKYFPEYNELIRECENLEKNPSNNWEYIESIAGRALAEYIALGKIEMGW